MNITDKPLWGDAPGNDVDRHGKGIDPAMEMELMKNQKLASVGQLTAGVAHEINNPTWFISSNLETLAEYMTDLNRLISEYQAVKEQLKKIPEVVGIQNIPDMIKNIEALEAQIDYDYLKNDITALIEESRYGTERIKKIVEDLKRFVHPDQDKTQETDVNALLDATLNVINNELKYKATVTKLYGDLPCIFANPQQLNQVFANILINASQAIEKNGEIRIETQHLEDCIRIRISDNGSGIAEKNLERIFDPFFTTKDTGKGTGLGMHIAFRIVKKHRGDIQVESRVGEGTTFSIQLPLNREQEMDGAVTTH